MTPGRGRPRRVSDEEVFSALGPLVRRQGLAALTVAEVARAVGMSAPALVQRFGGKEQLIAAYLSTQAAPAEARQDPDLLSTLLARIPEGPALPTRAGAAPRSFEDGRAG